MIYELISEGRCRWCNAEANERHHLFRRSTNPGMKEDKSNLVLLCHACHKSCTENRDVELLFQAYFFNKQDEKVITLKRIIDTTNLNRIISPRELAEYHLFLASEYARLNERYKDLKEAEINALGEIRDREGITSDKQADREWGKTPEGKELRNMDIDFKKIKVLLAAIKNMQWHQRTEARNQY